MIRPPPTSTLFPYTTLFRSHWFVSINTASFHGATGSASLEKCFTQGRVITAYWCEGGELLRHQRPVFRRSEEHTSELQSHSDLVCRLLLEKKKKKNNIML